MTGASEYLRQLVHIAVGGGAFLLRFLTWPQAALLSGLAAAMNLTLLPRLAPRLFRSADRDRLARSGIVLYPIAVLALILVFRRRLDLAAAAWAILAAGDGAATLVGAHVRSAPLAWNPRKSIAGLASFIVFGGLAGAAAFLWTGQPPVGGPLPVWWLVAMPLMAAIVAAFVETAPIRLDDNISVPAAAALVLWSLSHVDPAPLAGLAALVAGRLGPAVVLNAAVAWAGWRAGTVTVPGAMTGAVIGTAIFVGAGWPGWTILLVSFAAAVAATKLGHRRKAALGIAEARGGRRGPGNAIANTGVAAWAALVAIGMSDPTAAWLAMTAALVTGASDTVASEIGKAWGRTTRLVAGFGRVPPGTSGAVSTEGTIAGILAAAALAGIAAALGVVPTSAILVVVIAATAASLVEGALGATLEASGVLDNDALNFVNTLLGAGFALAIFEVF
jgi:uncharacterized protein (TIGR00297 family)